ncbi:MAG: hypothetical protein G01um10148_610 [Parcubacteria group bacterium Gr01-1014_8]|nr:MAG: hypothetical protein G01um10148_610 [Parcubacteria group bacterium Gr01-1014_8]
MNKAFIFDMDGVLIDSERIWLAHDKRILDDLFTGEARIKMGNSIGLNIRGIHEKAARIGHPVDIKTLANEYGRVAPEVYELSKITHDIDALVERLIGWNFMLGVVSASPQRDIAKVLTRIATRKKFEVTVSLADRHDLQPKPSPDGYLEALRELNADAKQSFILEDSNYGIEAGKSAGCTVIGYRGNLIDGYEQTGADEYANTMDDVAEIVKKRATQP